MKTFDERRDEMDFGNDSKYLTGWQHLLEKADEILAALDPDYKIIQIKEKFGALRYYYKITNEPPASLMRALSETIGDIEAASARTCERCGCESERKNRDYWVTTICDECFGKVPKD